MNPHLGDLTFNRLPISKIPSLCLPQTSGDANLTALVRQGVEPGDELFGLADGEREITVAIWIQSSSCGLFGGGLTRL